MYGFLFVLWLILNAQVTLEIVLTGIGLVAIIAILAALLCGYTPRKEWKMLCLFPYLAAYGALVIYNVLVANKEMMGYIWHKDRPLSPAVVEFESGLSHNLCRFLLTESITLTPGTITVKMEGSRLSIHAMSPKMTEGMEKSPIMKILRRMEAIL